MDDSWTLLASLSCSLAVGSCFFFFFFSPRFIRCELFFPFAGRDHVTPAHRPGGSRLRRRGLAPEAAARLR